MLTQDQYKSHQQFVQEQIAASPTFADELAKAREQTRFALALAEMREARGLTQRDLAAMTGIKQPMLARIERGQVPTLPILRRLAAALDARIVINPAGVVLVEPVGTEEAAQEAA